MPTKRVEQLLTDFEATIFGDPWFGRSVISLLNDTKSKNAYVRPGNSPHSAADLLYHMLTWAEFTLHRINESKEMDAAMAEELDWRKIDPKIHKWDDGVKKFTQTSKKIVAAIKKKDDTWLSNIVEYRKYNFDFLITGLIQHNIYHAGQIAFLNKLV